MGAERGAIGVWELTGTVGGMGVGGGAVAAGVTGAAGGTGVGEGTEAAESMGAVRAAGGISDIWPTPLSFLKVDTRNSHFLSMKWQWTYGPTLLP